MKQHQKQDFNLLEVALLGEQACKDHLAFSRWGNKPICPYCEHDKCYTTKTCYKCAKCRRVFNVTVGTIFHDSRIKLHKWYIAIYLITAHKKGISSHQLGRDIDVTQKTAWYMLHRIRHTFKHNGYKEKLRGTVEADETFVGGKNINRHWDKKVKNSQGRSFKDKTPVLGLIQRGGKLRAFKIPDTKKKTIQPYLLENIKRKSRLMTDEWVGYSGVKKYFIHKFVNHKLGQYGRGKVYVNTIEGFWSLFKRGILGIYHQVSRKHLDKYIDEFAYRYNLRKKTSRKKFQRVLKCKEQLSYKNLIKAI